MNVAKFHTKSLLDKSLNTLVGTIEGIAIDGHVMPGEVEFLAAWLREHEEIENRHPYNELAPLVRSALADGRISEEERQDILWLCRKLMSSEYYSEATGAMQRLHAALGSIAGDGEITIAELQGLRAWLHDHAELESCWPYDEVNALVTGVLRDGIIDQGEHRLLMDFFTEFTALFDNRTLNRPQMAESRQLVGVCAVCPAITFEGRTFCFTGTSTRYKRSDLAEMVMKLGGTFTDTIRQNLNYLIIGADGNPTWAYACYGRKVEKAIELRRKGERIIIVHENDFHDAVADA